MYRIVTDEIRALFGNLVEGTGTETVLVISSTPISSEARSALVKSVAALGYGEAACAFVSLCMTEPDEANSSTETSRGAEVRETTISSPNPTSGPTPNSSPEKQKQPGPRPDRQTPHLGADDLRVVIEGFDPLCLIITDRNAASLVANGYRQTIRLMAASRVLGRDVVAFESFEGMLGQSDDKQRAWAVLKRLPRF